MTRTYVSGPMRDLPLFNFPAFDEAKAALEAAGHDVVSPADHDRELGFDPTRTLESQGFDLTAALAWDFAAILTCDCVALLNDWRKSAGAKAEVFVAANAGLHFLRVEQGRIWEIPAPNLKVVPA